MGIAGDIPAERVANQPEYYRVRFEQMPVDSELSALAGQIYQRVVRTNFEAPGFVLLPFGSETDSLSLRRFMIALKDAFTTTFQKRTGRHLTLHSATRFDQQVTTKFHLDGAPEESYLMLGYEPSSVQSALAMADYTRAAQDLNLTPAQFLDEYNPMFAHGEQKLLPYITRLEKTDSAYPQLLLINNSSLPFQAGSANSLGVMHQATILTPDPTQSRIVNSMMLAVSTTEDERTTAHIREEAFLSMKPARLGE